MTPAPRMPMVLRPKLVIDMTLVIMRAVGCIGIIMKSMGGGPPTHFIHALMNLLTLGIGAAAGLESRGVVAYHAVPGELYQGNAAMRWRALWKLERRLEITPLNKMARRAPGIDLLAAISSAPGSVAPIGSTSHIWNLQPEAADPRRPLRRLHPRRGQCTPAAAGSTSLPPLLQFGGTPRCLGPCASGPPYSAPSTTTRTVWLRNGHGQAKVSPRRIRASRQPSGCRRCEIASDAVLADPATPKEPLALSSDMPRTATRFRQLADPATRPPPLHRAPLLAASAQTPRTRTLLHTPPLAKWRGTRPRRPARRLLELSAPRRRDR
jgi:hypothetical protein